MVMQEAARTGETGLKIQEILREATAHHNQLTSFGLSRGILGLSLLHYLYGKWTGDSKHLSDALDWFNEACSRLSDTGRGSFTLDLSELGIMTEYFSREGILTLDVNEFLSDVDTLLHEQMLLYIRQGNIGGFVNGALSMGLYFLHRLESDRPRFGFYLHELISAIEQQAVEQPEGNYWRSYFKPQENLVYLTFPHGSAAILLFLTALAGKEVENRAMLEPLVRKGVSFLLAQEVNGRFYSFPDTLHSEAESRLALCYGDLGVCYMLLRAGQVFGEATWTATAHRVLAQACVRRDEETSKVKDAGILFGATGLAIAFTRLYHLTKVELYRETAAYWFESIEKFAVHPDGYAGFKSAYNQWHPHTNVSFCEGIIGIGAGLIKSVSPDEVDIDELLWLL